MDFPFSHFCLLTWLTSFHISLDVQLDVRPPVVPGDQFLGVLLSFRHDGLKWCLLIGLDLLAHRSGFSRLSLPLLFPIPSLHSSMPFPLLDLSFSCSLSAFWLIRWLLLLPSLFLLPCFSSILLKASQPVPLLPLASFLLQVLVLAFPDVILPLSSFLLLFLSFKQFLSF